jgi:hypothetical protein
VSRGRSAVRWFHPARRRGARTTRPTPRAQRNRSTSEDAFSSILWPPQRLFTPLDVTESTDSPSPALPARPPRAHHLLPWTQRPTHLGTQSLDMQPNGCLTELGNQTVA